MPEAPTPSGEWERYLCAPVTGRKVICAFEVLAGLTHTVASLRRWGSDRPLLIADGIGTGAVVTAAEAEIEMLEGPVFPTLTEQVRARMKPSERLTPSLVAAVERYDTDQSALWWLSPVTPNSPLLGRAVLGGRPPSQVALENKILVDGLLDDIGAPRSASVNASASYGELMRATQTVLEDTAAESVVWAGDSRDGINGGADYIRWIRTPDHAVDAALFFATHCDRVRVSPFLEGVPCSVHGIVLPDGVVVLRPMELVSLRRPDAGRFFYGGMGTSWAPCDHASREMCELARAIGGHLRRAHGYRGGFGVDGVLTAEGFRVTELNPRFSGGLSRLASAADGAHLELVHVNALIGRDVRRSAREVEEDALSLLEENHFAVVMGMSTTPATDTVEVSVRAEGSRLVVATDGDALATVQWGPAGVGSFVRLTVGDAVVQPGDRCAPLGVLLCEFADRMWDTGFGQVEMAPDATGPPVRG